MLDHNGFDLWADGYDQTVRLSDEADEYPFAGYKNTLGILYSIVRQNGGGKILDVGFGTGILTRRLYDDGCAVYGIDFSDRMIAIAREKMPRAHFLRHDFSEGYPAQWQAERFDHILCTYAIHHLTDARKIAFIRELLGHLTPDGALLIGDVAFETHAEQDACRRQSGDLWDDDEVYCVAEDLRRHFPALQFLKTSCCAGILTFKS